MIKIRRYEEGDLPGLLELSGKRRSQLRMPEEWLLNPEDANNFVTLLAVEEERPVAALIGRTVAEGFLTLDGEWGSARERWELLRGLFGSGMAIAQQAGFKEVCAGVPEGLERYAERLQRELGFVRDPRQRLFLNLKA